MKTLFVVGIVLALFTCSLAEESSQNDIHTRNVEDHQSLPVNYLRQTTVNSELQSQQQPAHPYRMNNAGYQQWQQQPDWEEQKAHAQAQRFHGSSQYQQPWIPHPNYIQHNHINQQQQVHPLNLNKHYVSHQPEYPQQLQYYRQQQPQLYQPVVTRYQKPQLIHVATAHKVVYPVQMRPPPMKVTMKVLPAATGVAQKAFPILMYRVAKPATVPGDMPFAMFMNHQPGSKPVPVQVIIREDGNHKNKPFWGLV